MSTDQEPWEIVEGVPEHPKFIQEWVEQFKRDSEDPHSDVSGWFSAESARFELGMIQNANDEATRRTAEAALFSRVILHVGAKERQLAKAINEANKENQEAIKRLNWLAVLLTAVLAVSGIIQAIASLG